MNRPHLNACASRVPTGTVRRPACTCGAANVSQIGQDDLRQIADAMRPGAVHWIDADTAPTLLLHPGAVNWTDPDAAARRHVEGSPRA